MSGDAREAPSHSMTRQNLSNKTNSKYTPGAEPAIADEECARPIAGFSSGGFPDRLRLVPMGDAPDSL
jgi:hypothetical protein